MRCPTTRWGRALRRLLKSERGAVYTEAVITLPFFIMIWAFLIYTHSTVEQKISNNATAKGCTWAYALNYCQRDGLPAACGGTTFGEEPPAEWSDSDVADFLRSVPLVGDIVLGKGAYGERGADVRRPGYLGGGGRTRVISRHSVSCNEKPKTVGELFTSVFDSVRSSIFP
jgi:hypothetical protein